MKSISANLYLCLPILLLAILFGCEPEETGPGSKPVATLQLQGAQLIFSTGEAVYTLNGSDESQPLKDSEGEHEHLAVQLQQLYDLDQEYALIFREITGSKTESELLHKPSGNIYSIVSIGPFMPLKSAWAPYFPKVISMRSQKHLYIKGRKLVRVNLNNVNQSEQISLDGELVEDFTVDQQDNLLYVSELFTDVSMASVGRYQKAAGSFASVPMGPDASQFHAVGQDPAGNFYFSVDREMSNEKRVLKLDKGDPSLVAEHFMEAPYVYGDAVKLQGNYHYVSFNAPTVCQIFDDDRPFMCHISMMYLEEDELVDDQSRMASFRDGSPFYFGANSKMIQRHVIKSEEVTDHYTAPAGALIKGFTYQPERKRLLISLFYPDTNKGELIALDDTGNQKTIFLSNEQPIISLIALE